MQVIKVTNPLRIYSHTRPSINNILGGFLCRTVIPENKNAIQCTCGIFMLEVE